MTNGVFVIGRLLSYPRPAKGRDIQRVTFTLVDVRDVHVHCLAAGEVVEAIQFIKPGTWAIVVGRLTRGAVFVEDVGASLRHGVAT